MSRTFNNKIGYTILDLIYRYDAHGISYRELYRKGNFNFKTLTGWLKRLKSLGFIYSSKRSIHFTPKEKQKYEDGFLVIPTDPRSKKRELKSKDIDPLLLILFNSAHHTSKFQKIDVDDDGIHWGTIIHLPGITLADITKIRFKRLYHPFMPNPPVFENRINGVSLEIFRHLKIPKDKAKTHIKFLIDKEILKEISIDCSKKEVRYVIKDEKLKEFILHCLLAFNPGVYRILNYCFKYEMLDKEQIRQYKKYITKLFGSKQNYYSLDLFQDSKSRYVNVDKTMLKKEVDRAYGMVFADIDLPKDMNVSTEINKAVQEIYKHHIFDDELEEINDKYKFLQEKYPEIIKAISEALFPKFLMVLIRKKYKKLKIN